MPHAFSQLSLDEVIPQMVALGPPRCMICVLSWALRFLSIAKRALPAKHCSFSTLVPTSLAQQITCLLAHRVMQSSQKEVLKLWPLPEAFPSSSMSHVVPPGWRERHHPLAGGSLLLWAPDPLPSHDSWTSPWLHGGVPLPFLFSTSPSFLVPSI